MVDFVANKNRILALLKQQLREMKRGSVDMKDPPPNFKVNSQKRRYTQSRNNEISMNVKEEKVDPLLESPKNNP
jgi:hypothetical protein